MEEKHYTVIVKKILFSRSSIERMLVPFSVLTSALLLRPPLHVRCRDVLCSADDEMSAEDNLRLARARLTEEWRAGVLRRKPRFLPFMGARQWARAMPFETEDDWREWIRAGEKRNAYVPSNPDEVYEGKGWAGWADFLNGEIEPTDVVFQKGYRRGRWLRGPLSDVEELRPDEDREQ